MVIIGLNARGSGRDGATAVSNGAARVAEGHSLRLPGIYQLFNSQLYSTVGVLVVTNVDLCAPLCQKNTLPSDPIGFRMSCHFYQTGSWTSDEETHSLHVKWRVLSIVTDATGPSDSLLTLTQRIAVNLPKWFSRHENERCFIAC